MLIAETFILSIFFLAWSILLRNIANFLIKDCTSSPHPSADVKTSDFAKASTDVMADRHKLRPYSPHPREGGDPCLLSLKWGDLLATAWWLFAAYKITNFIPAYFLFLSALWITLHTDLQHMLISRFVSLYLLPIGIFLAFANLLPITAYESIIAATLGYALFWIINKIFYVFNKHDGLGQGDLELIAMIGAFTGIIGSWCTILFASLAGTIVGCCTMLFTRNSARILPFGPFLAFGAATFSLYQYEILNYLTRYN